MQMCFYRLHKQAIRLAQREKQHQELLLTYPGRVPCNEVGGCRANPGAGSKRAVMLAHLGSRIKSPQTPRAAPRHSQTKTKALRLWSAPFLQKQVKQLCFPDFQSTLAVRFAPDGVNFEFLQPPTCASLCLSSIPSPVRGRGG